MSGQAAFLAILIRSERTEVAAWAQQEAAELADQNTVSTLYAQGGDPAAGTERHPGPPVRPFGGVEGSTGK